MVDGDLGTYSTRVFAAESFTFSVRCDTPAVCDAVEVLFSDLPDGDGPADEFSIVQATNGFRLLGPEPWSADGQRDGDTILNDLVTAVNRKRLDAGEGRLHLHAGLVENDGTAVVVAGSSGRGKTTLVTTLALRGWVYLTDEATSIALGDQTVRAFPKPVTVKEPGTEFFPELAQHRVLIDDAGIGLWNVPLGRAGVSTATMTEPNLIVLLTRGDSPEPSWEPVRPADVIVALVEQTLDLERYGDDALLALAELCSRRRSVHVVAGTPDATAQLVEKLAAEDNSMDLPIERLGDRAQDSIIEPDVVGVAIGDEVVLRHRGTGQVISLNPAAAQIWQAIARSGSDVATLGPEATSFVEQLAHLQFVRDVDAETVDAEATRDVD